MYQIVVTEIPYQVQKSRLIEKIAELLIAKKLPLLSDIRDESTELVRVVLEPRSKNIEAEHLMEHLFRQTELESRFSLNMNVLSANHTPRVMNLRDAMQAFLDHRQVVLVRVTSHRLDKIARRLEMLGGFIIAFLNLDEVIRIIREEDDAKISLMKAFELSDIQAEAISRREFQRELLLHGETVGGVRQQTLSWLPSISGRESRSGGGGHPFRDGDKFQR